MISRRTLLTGSAALIGGAMVPGRVLARLATARKFTMDLRTGSIGVEADQREQIRLASKFGFESVDASPNELAEFSGAELEELVGTLHESKLVWGAAGLPVEFRKDDVTFQNDLRELPKRAAALQKAGVSRVGTWLMPNSDELTYAQNLRQHASRLRQCAKILADHQQRLGLEYVGPRTLWTAKRYPFVHSMAETKDLIGEIGTDNVGFVLDSWHWFTAEESVDDLHTLTPADIVACDLNDAPKDRRVEEQIDSQRELPMATGVINLKAFLGALVAIGYDGPIRAEPFNSKLNEMDNEAAVSATSEAMRKAFALVD